MFLLSLRQALTADPHWNGRGFTGTPEQGLRSFALIYASWAASQAFYRQGSHLALGYQLGGGLRGAGLAAGLPSP